MNTFDVYDTYMIKATEVLEYSRNALEKICDEPDNGWLSEIFNQMTARLFPESFTANDDPAFNKAVDFFMRKYQEALDDERSMRAASPVDDFVFFTEEEFGQCTNADEYRRFLEVWRAEYIYEYMRLAREVTPFNTCGHVAGVHYIATFIARQIATYETSTDLGIISAAAACHDLGKFGCVGDELRKVAHYHYYYTSVICQRFGLPMIAHIAGNHSTWDLELENLSIESLILIYADFRVRSHREDGVEVAKFYTLDEAFDIVLGKLENVDDAKKDRYRKVYMKLKDFELYLRSLGVETNPEMPPAENAGEGPCRDPLLNGNEVTDRLKNLAFRHNIRIMSIFNNEVDFGSLLEDARTENNPSIVRAYLNILDEYSQYMTKHEKLMALRFLYDQLSNREGDIRRTAATTMGKLIARYQNPATKLVPDRFASESNDSLEVWRAYLGRVVYPGHRVTDQHRRWIRYTLKMISKNVIAYADKAKAHDYISVFLEFFRDDAVSSGAIFAMIEVLHHIPFEMMTDDDLHIITDVLGRFKDEPQPAERTAILDIIEVFSAWDTASESLKEALKNLLQSFRPEPDEIADFYIYKKAERNLYDTGESDRDILVSITSRLEDQTTVLMRDNLKTATPWVIKTANISFLLDYAINCSGTDRNFFLASHLSNLLKVSEKVTVRKMAGRSLVGVASKLPSDQVNELVIELAKGLEIGDYQFSKYIPEYLGRLGMFLLPGELDEFIDELGGMLDSNNFRISSVALDTIGEMLQDSFSYNYREEPDSSGLVKREKIMLGYLLKGLSCYNEEVSRKALLIIGQYIFGSGKLTLEEKYLYYRYFYKKLLTLLKTDAEGDINFYNNAAALNHIYRFVTDYSFLHGEIELPQNKRIAFFPGTFDPFSSGHKGIVDAIRNEGFETYLALDEFSWSKNTQPRMRRREIISMSIAASPDVFLFLDDFPVNIANPEDIRQLKNVFAGKEVYMVAGSDVIINASSYKAMPQDDSIHTMNHIIFRRESAEMGDESEEKLKAAYENISGKIYELKLPPYLEDISSTQIRDNIDDGRDISKLIDPVAQSYIYANGMYLREPMYKSVLETKDINIENHKKPDDRLIHCVMGSNEGKLLEDYLASAQTMHTSIRNSAGDMMGYALYHSVDVTELYDEFKDIELATEIRNQASGKILVIRELSVSGGNDASRVVSTLLTEVLADACERGITYGIYHPLKKDISQMIMEAFERFGFLEVALNNVNNEGTGIWAVDMKAPIVLVENMDRVIKNPFNTNANVLTVLQASHQKLQKAVSALLPGNLVLSFNAGIMNNRIVHMVTAANGVPDTPTVPRKFGADMCVPFGKFIGNTVIPNTVTKTLHTEKKFSAKLDSFTIEEFPMYASIENQVRTIKSFSRPVILVDDLLHKGYRLKHLDPIMKRNDIQIKKIIVGILSGHGKDLMSLQEREVESAYFIPNLKSWFVESTLYPFIGGDSVESDDVGPANLIASVNLIPPFAAMGFLYMYDKEAVYELAMTCLENTKEIFKVLEDEYLDHFERQLTIRRLSDVIRKPRRPAGSNISEKQLAMSPSSYIDDYIYRLERLKNAML